MSISRPVSCCQQQLRMSSQLSITTEGQQAHIHHESPRHLFPHSSPRVREIRNRPRSHVPCFTVEKNGDFFASIENDSLSVRPAYLVPNSACKAVSRPPSTPSDSRLRECCSPRLLHSAVDENIALRLKFRVNRRSERYEFPTIHCKQIRTGGNLSCLWGQLTFDPCPSSCSTIIPTARVEYGRGLLP